MMRRFSSNTENIVSLTNFLVVNFYSYLNSTTWINVVITFQAVTFIFHFIKWNLLLDTLSFDLIYIAGNSNNKTLTSLSTYYYNSEHMVISYVYENFVTTSRYTRTMYFLLNLWYRAFTLLRLDANVLSSNSTGNRFFKYLFNSRISIHIVMGT